MDTRSLIEERIRSAFSPIYLEVIDDSHKHAGHAGAKGGGGHFSALIVSSKFQDLGLLERHRQVYALFGEEMKQRIHALALKTLTPEQWRSP